MNEGNHPPDLKPIWQLMTGFQHSAAFKTAVELEVFTRISEGSSTAPDIAKACGAAERGIRILADTLTVLGMLNRKATGIR